MEVTTCRDRSGAWFGIANMVRWDRHGVSRYLQAQMRKSDLGTWCARLGRRHGLCYLFNGGAVEAEDLLVFECLGSLLSRGWEWLRWICQDKRLKWAYEYEENEKLVVGDQVRDFLAWLGSKIYGVG